MEGGSEGDRALLQWGTVFYLRRALRLPTGRKSVRVCQSQYTERGETDSPLAHLRGLTSAL